MIRLYKYVFSRYFKYYYRVDGDKDTAVFFGIMLMSVTNCFIILSVYVLVSDTNKLFFLNRSGIINKIITIVPLLVFCLTNYFYLIKMSELNEIYYEIIEEYELRRKHYNVSFYGYFICILFLFIISIIKVVLTR